jgi:hypothetical protein
LVDVTQRALLAIGGLFVFKIKSEIIVLDITYKDTWETRGLTPEEYKVYLKSDEWKMIKSNAKKRKHYQKCWICKRKDNLEIHHRSYKWIGTKDCMRGLVAMCRDCHQDVHDYARIYHVSVRIATNRLKK